MHKCIQEIKGLNKREVEKLYVDISTKNRETKEPIRITNRIGESYVCILMCESKLLLRENNTWENIFVLVSWNLYYIAHMSCCGDTNQHFKPIR